MEPLSNTLCTLKFDYTDHRFRIGDISNIAIPENLKSEFENKVNKKWGYLCEKLNKSEGYVKVSVSQDGTKILKGTIIANPDILDYLNDNDIPSVTQA